MKNFRIIPVSSESEIDNEIEIIKKILKISTLHVRKFGFFNNLLIILSIPKELRKNIVLHGNIFLAVFFGCGGIHLKSSQNTGSLNLKICRYFQSKGFSISTSIHSKLELEACLKSNIFDYYFVGAVFNSYTKLGYKARFTNEELIEMTQLTDRLIAIGGLDQSNIQKIKDWNFMGAAMIGSIWNSDNPVSQLKEYQNEFCS